MQNKKWKRWSDEDKALFADVYGKKPLPEMCDLFQRTPSSIYQMAKQIGKRLKTNSDRGKGDFEEFMYEQLEKKRGTISKESYYTYKTALTKIIQFNPDVSFKNLSEDFISAYREWMIVRGNNENTISKSLRTLRTFINLAVRFKKIKENPFQYYRIKKVTGKRQFMSKDDFNRLYALFEQKAFIGLERNAVHCFLISCTTGLRYGDLKRFKPDFIDKGFIRLKMHKTGHEVSIPIMDKAQKLLADGLKMYCNKVVNRNLKSALVRHGFDNRITFHVARHTFATISITLGMPIEVVSKLLGHTDIKTTQIYAKVVDEVKVREMAKWNF